MASNTYTAGHSCCFSGMATAEDPMMKENTVPAGGVCGESCEAEKNDYCACKLAVIYFPMQTYRAGYCPTEALKKGTLFPELVSPFTSGGCV